MSTYWTQQHNTTHTLFQFITRARLTLVDNVVSNLYTTNCSGPPSVVRNPQFILVHSVNRWQLQIYNRRIWWKNKSFREKCLLFLIINWSKDYFVIFITYLILRIRFSPTRLVQAVTATCTVGRVKLTTESVCDKNTTTDRHLVDAEECISDHRIPRADRPSAAGVAKRTLLARLV